MLSFIRVNGASLGKRNHQIWLLGCDDMVILVIKASTLGS